MTEGMWRCKACGMILSTKEIEDNGGFCKDCIHE
jgi:acetyl-CoA carboxylase beta subunit